MVMIYFTITQNWLRRQCRPVMSTVPAWMIRIILGGQKCSFRYQFCHVLFVEHQLSGINSFLSAFPLPATKPVTWLKGWASPGYGTSCQDFGASFKNSKKICGLRPSYLLAAASWRRAILSRAYPVRRGGGEGVHVASYILVLHRSGQGGAICT